MAGKGKPRRPKGTSFIYGREGVVIGQYEVRMPEGKIKRKYVRGKDKKRVASKLAKAIADRDSGVVYDSENMTVGEYLAAKRRDSPRTPEAQVRRDQTRQAGCPQGPNAVRCEAGVRALPKDRPDNP